MSNILLELDSIRKEIKKGQITKLKTLNGASLEKCINPSFLGIGNNVEFVDRCCAYAKEIGLNPTQKIFSGNASVFEIQRYIDELNEDHSTFAITIQRPIDLENAINETVLLDYVINSKDVAGVSLQNRSLTSHNGHEPFLTSSTLACLEFISRGGIQVAGKEVAFLLFPENIIEFEPLIHILKKNKAIVVESIVEDGQINQNLERLISKADIVISHLNSSMPISKLNVKSNAMILDFASCYSSIQDLKISYLFQNIIYAMERFISDLCEAHWNLNLLRLKTLDSVPSDSEISLAQSPKPISSLVKEIGLGLKDIVQYGEYTAKVQLNVMEKYSMRQNGNYVLVAGINPTPFGEGKSTTTIGLCQALGSQSKKNVFACVRQPSQGPTFGIKGGAAGGGYSQVIPMQDFNMHLTGDIHAVTAANNLLAAQIDARVFHEEDQRQRGRSAGIKGMFSRLVPGKKKAFSQVQLERLNKLGIHKTIPSELTEDEKERFSFLNIDPTKIMFNRVIDINDRMLRKITIGQSPTEKGRTRETKFDITVASEIMAILSLAEDLEDMKNRLAKMVVAFDTAGGPVCAHDLGVVEALCGLLKDALKPTLMQTLEGTPVLVHTGPFANIAHGNSSILADKIALKLVGSNGFVVTEAGFGADIGMEKFFNIKCRFSKLVPNAMVIVCTIRALKMHGDPVPKTGDALTRDTYTQEDETLLRKGFENVGRHIENANKFNVPVVVCVNQFKTDTNKELTFLRDLCLENGAFDCVISNHWAKGGFGAKDLASSVVKACEAKDYKFKFLYPLNKSISEKITIVAKEIYRAGTIEYSDEAKKQIEVLEAQGFGNLPICVAKTQFSFSADPNLKGAPKDFVFPIKSITPSIGAGFLVVFAGSISTMPGLPVRPCFYDMFFDTKTENLSGLF